MAKKAVPLIITSEQRAELEKMASSQVLEYRVVRQAKALLLAADGRHNTEIARRCDISERTMYNWRNRFQRDGVASVGTVAKGRGRPKQISDETVEAIVHDTLHTAPDDGSVSWSTRSMEKRHGVSKDTVARIWKARNLKPWKKDTFKLSGDPHFEEGLRDVVGLYHKQPEDSIVYSFDEKTQIQALERTQPSLPMKPGRCNTLTHDYKRHGTIDLFAAVNVATGEVLHETRKRHTGKDVLAFFKRIDRNVPQDLDIHIILDNVGTHKCGVVHEWLADPKRKRWYLHFTPTSSSWLNIIENRFSKLTRKAIINNSFTSVKQVIQTINTWTANYNNNPNPVIWKKTADEIIAKINRGLTTLTHATNLATNH